MLDNIYKGTVEWAYGIKYIDGIFLDWRISYIWNFYWLQNMNVSKIIIILLKIYLYLKLWRYFKKGKND